MGITVEVNMLDVLVMIDDGELNWKVVDIAKDD